MAHAEWGIC